MINTFFGVDALGSPAALINAIIIGFVFGWCFEQAGLTSSKKMAGVFHFSDMSLLKTSLTALLTASLGLGLLLKSGIIAPDFIDSPLTVVYAQCIGGLLFGIGFVMSGWTASSSVAGLATGRLDALVFMVFVVIGIITFNEAFYYYKLLFELGDAGVSFICEYMKVSWFKSVAVFCILGIALLWIAEFIDEDCDYNEVAKNGKGLWIFTMFVVIISGSLIIPSEEFNNEKNSGIVLKERTDVSAYEGGIITSNNSESSDHLSRTLNISPVTYAREKVEGLKKIILVDLRAREKYDEWHVNGSYNYPIDAIALSLDRFRKFERIILLGSTEETSEAHKLLDNAKFKNVYILDGGIEGFKDEVLNEEKLLSEKISEEEKLERNVWRKMFDGASSASGAADPISLNSLIGAD